MVNDWYIIYCVINSFVLFFVWEYNLCWYLKFLNLICSLYVLLSWKKIVIYIDKDSFYVNWRKKKLKRMNNF